jgi:two-component system sensor histidine kinase DegS
MQMRTLGDAGRGRFDAIQAEAKQALMLSAAQLQGLIERSAAAHAEAAAELASLHSELAVTAARDAAEDRARSASLKGSIELATVEHSAQRAELARLQLALDGLENSRAFLDAEIGADSAGRTTATEHDIQMRVLEAQESERARLAREIHDGPAHSLANAVFQAEFAARLLGRDPAAAAAELTALRALLQRALHDTRGFITQLRPPELDRMGLDEALREHAETLERSSMLKLTMDLRAPADTLSVAEQTVVLRVAQEALRNVRKHAATARVSVATRLDEVPEEEEEEEGAARVARWVLEVSDDGKGFDVEQVMSDPGWRRHFGLRFMRERAALIGARLEIGSGPSAGTTIRLSIDRAERS